jgi:hypothetical protein
VFDFLISPSFIITSVCELLSGVGRSITAEEGRESNDLLLLLLFPSGKR